MPFPKLTFPLTVDFAGEEYWIGDHGPYRYGEATTDFFGDGSLSGRGYVKDELLLMRSLERYLRAFGGHLQSYARPQDQNDPDARGVTSSERFETRCSVCFALRKTSRSARELVERYTFDYFSDFLHVELCKAISKGNAPRECRFCRRWFLHEQGDKMMYCENPAPGNREGRTCREIGARAVFERKIQEDEAWRIYKRAYKKYYARVMKGKMSKEDFDAWVKRASKLRDEAVREMNGKDLDKTALENVIETLRRFLNQL